LRPWLTIFGVAAALVGASQLWNSDDPRQGLTFIIITQSGLALLAGLWGSAQAVVAVVAQTLTLLVGGGLLYLANGFDERRPWLTLLAGVGAGAIAGFPLTIGFTGLNILISALIKSGHWALWLALAGILAAHAFMVGGLLRIVFWPGDPVEGGSVGLVGYLSGLGALAAFAVLAGLLIGLVGQTLGAPINGILGLAGQSSWVALGLTALAGVAGFGLWRFEQATRARTGSAASLIVTLLRLDWLYRLAWNGIRLVDRLMYNVAGVLEGEGALLWALVVALAVILLFRG
jgi:formate hydrogenlyase subunit 3/multisubunit Na+/H+ antiporter MnhD subunit